MASYNKKKDFQDYLDRWQLVREMEDKEIREAQFDLMFKQTIAIWDIGRTLNFFNETETSEFTWSELQKKWINSHKRIC